MKFCSIVPIKNLELVNDRPYNMLLVHLCKYPKYVEWAKNLIGYKILDNSLIEMGSACSLEELMEYASLCQADEIILPDVFTQGEETCKLANHYVNELTELKRKYPLKKFPKLMAVCHGVNKKEFEESFKKLSKIAEIDVIGIPKVVSSWCGNRSELFEIYSKSNKEIHLLGCWNSLDELKSFDKNMKKRIRTIDTCLPSLVSLYGDDPFKERDHSRTIDLINDDINLKNYNKIINMVDDLLRE